MINQRTEYNRCGRCQFLTITSIQNSIMSDIRCILPGGRGREVDCWSEPCYYFKRTEEVVEGECLETFLEKFQLAQRVMTIIQKEELISRHCEKTFYFVGKVYNVERTSGKTKITICDLSEKMNELLKHKELIDCYSNINWRESLQFNKGDIVKVFGKIEKGDFLRVFCGQFLEDCIFEIIEKNHLEISFDLK